MKTTLIYMLAAVPIAACSSSRPTSEQAPPVKWSIEPARAAVASAETTSVRIDAQIERGWHIYSVTQPAGGPIATRITVPAGQQLIASGTPVPSAPPRTSFDGAFHMDVQLHENTVGFIVPLRAATTGATQVRVQGGAPSNARVAMSSVLPESVHVNVRYQVCNDSLCFPPQTARLAAAVASSAP